MVPSPDDSVRPPGNVYRGTVLCFGLVILGVCCWVQGVFQAAGLLGFGEDVFDMA